MGKTGMHAVVNDIEKDLKSMLDRSNALAGYLNRNAYAQYQNAQRKRWMTENESEGKRWEPLNTLYKRRKIIKYAGSPGAGTKLMIATDRLRASVVGPSTDHRKLISKNRFEISTSVEYAKYAGAKRPFMEFSEATEKVITDGIMQFLTQGDVS